MLQEKILLDGTSIDRTVSRLAHQIIECNDNIEEICLIGILRRGVPFADMLADKIEQFGNCRPPVGKLDISLYRDDLDPVADQPILNATDIPFNIIGKTVILADDVIYTGRTTRAAMDAVISIGRPAKIKLAVLIDRGHRELTIIGDYVGKNVPTSQKERIMVKFPQFDGKYEVSIITYN